MPNIDTIWEDIGYGKRCLCGQYLIGENEVKSGVCGFCYKPLELNSTVNK